MPPALGPNDLLALGSWILLMAFGAAMALGNARKNAGLALARVWYSLAALCGWWLASAVVGLCGGPFVLLYRIGIGLAALTLALLYATGSFRGHL